LSIRQHELEYILTVQRRFQANRHRGCSAVVFTAPNSVVEKNIATARWLWYALTVQSSETMTVLNDILEPVTNAFSREVAQALVNVRAGEAAQMRVTELADKCNEGLLTPAEQAEYESYVRAIDMVSVLQAKARVWLKRHQAS
jgi:hypothetical protein